MHSFLRLIERQCFSMSKIEGRLRFPFGPLKYLYLGSSNIKRDIEYYSKILGAAKVWDRSGFGARVAAFQLGEGPILLLADHRPAGSCIMIFQVDNLEKTSGQLRERGWKAEGEEFEVPEGPCYRFNDPSGNALALLQIVRPNIFGQ